MNIFNENGLPHGSWEYYSNGNLWYKENFVNGKLHGLCVEYLDNGNPSHKTNYVNGNSNGICEKYNYNGKLFLKLYYI